MIDRELLELAAKAAGLDNFAWYENTVHGHSYPVLGHVTKPWNPLTDDGDALRLAARLSIDIEWQNVGDYPEPFVEAHRRSSDGEAYFCASEEDLDYRRAIVRAAAEIGKAIP